MTESQKIFSLHHSLTSKELELHMNQNAGDPSTPAMGTVIE